MISMNERYAPNMVAVPFDRLEQLIRAEAMLEAMLAEYDRSDPGYVGSDTYKNARAVLWGVEEQC